MAAMQLTRTHRLLIGVVITGAVIIAGIGFAGSYAAVRELAVQKGFGDFSYFFPIGIDAGICVLLALDLLLTWIRIPFPLLRQTAWLLTAATIAFNGAAAWPDPLGVGMHAVIPVLFVVAVEAARHAVGRIADITADKHMEGVRLTRWLLSPVPTFRLWRRMKLWELRSYEQVIKLEQDRLIYQARLQARFGRAWRRKAPVEALMPLRLARYGVPLAETAPAGLAAAGIEPVLLPPNPTPNPAPVPAGAATTAAAAEQSLPSGPRPAAAALPQAATPAQPQAHPGPRPEEQAPPPRQAQQPQQPGPARAPQDELAEEFPAPHPEDGAPQPQLPGNHVSPWFAAPQLPPTTYDGTYDPAFDPDPAGVAQPAGPADQLPPEDGTAPGTSPGTAPGAAPDEAPDDELHAELDGADAQGFAGLAYPVFKQYVDENNVWPSVEVLDIHLGDRHGIRHPLSAVLLRRMLDDFKQRYNTELEAEHIA
ncbi:DUF2637 domain-containing protein [Streptomyces sp. NRRL S-118]|uniref:DUF2637 domain-containing protein n=1 Tax=Streptomyces sp. NRRL S-118 TaxID=1463881 RepID=UPI0004C78CC3|nr:DUF2637 domain-containing protein [Streptomyces sp. NRRL S-118]